MQRDGNSSAVLAPQLRIEAGHHAGRQGAHAINIGGHAAGGRGFRRSLDAAELLHLRNQARAFSGSQHVGRAPLLHQVGGIVAQQALGGGIDIGEAAIEADGDHCAGPAESRISLQGFGSGGGRGRGRRRGGSCGWGMRSASSTAAPQAASISRPVEAGPSQQGASQPPRQPESSARTARHDQRMKTPLGTARAGCALPATAISSDGSPMVPPKCSNSAPRPQQSMASAPNTVC